MLKKLIQSMLVMAAMLPGAWAAKEPVKTPVPRDFAYASSLTITRGAAIHEITIPKHVYQTVVRANLADLRVFNGKSEIVPHAIRQPVFRDIKTLAPVEVQIYPLYGKSGQSLDQLSVRVRQRGGETVVNVDSSSAGGGKKLVGYLLSTENIKQPIKALNLNWHSGMKDFVGRVRVERSNDLRRWYHVTYNAPVARMRYSGHRLERRRIKLSHLKTNFLRISWPSSQPPLRLISIKAELADQVVERRREVVTLDATVDDKKPGEYYFDTGGVMPVDRVEVQLPQKNTLVSAQLYSRSNPESAWRLRSGGLLYDLNINGNNLKNADFHLRPSVDRYWKLVVEQKEGGLGSALPGLRIGWLPQQLVFIARGDGPFRLAYGSVRPHIQDPDFQVDRLIGRFAGKDRLGIQQASVGSPEELSGPIALKPAWAETVAWKKWLLWGVLGLGVLLLAWMALSLIRQMGRDSAPDTGKNAE